jgi:large subunit ribosomal protein L31
LPSRASQRSSLCHKQNQPTLQSETRLSLFIFIVKADIQPKLNPVAFVDVSSGTKFLTRSTMRGSKTETIDGVDYQVVICDITSDSHPAFTGEKRFVDTAGRVEKFQSKFRRRS